MPLKIRITLAGEPPANPFQHATGLRALVLRWLQTADQAKPFRISPLQTEREERSRSWFETAVLADEIATPLMQGVKGSREEIRLGPQIFRLLSAEVVDAVSWQELLTPAPERDTWEFQLLTPTAHHAAGLFRKSIVLPDPENYFGSWMGRWNLCCEGKLDAALKERIAERVVVTACEGGTRAVRLDAGRTFIGFQGRVRFALLKPETAPAEAKTALTALARFASYCGTGVDTMRGMGQTCFLEG
jgi:CRISPR-associated endoribonuclease Cas6